MNLSPRRLTAGALLAAAAVATVTPSVALAGSHTTPAPRTAVAGLRAGEPVIDVTAANLRQVKSMASERPVVFLVTAPSWCGACQQLDPIIHKIANDGQGKWLLAVIDTDKAGGAEREFGVNAFPTMIPYGKNGEMSSPQRRVGAGDEATVSGWIDEVVSAYGPVDPTPGPPAPDPTDVPTPGPMPDPTVVPTPGPDPDPFPTVVPTVDPTVIPTPEPVPTTPAPMPTVDPTVVPTPGPVPTPEPTVDPTVVPTPDPSPTVTPAPVPTPDDGGWWQAFLDWLRKLFGR